MTMERKIYEDQGLEKYVEYQQQHENEPLKPGAAFPFVKVLFKWASSFAWVFKDVSDKFCVYCKSSFIP